MPRCPLAVLGFSAFAALTLAAWAGPGAALVLAVLCGALCAVWLCAALLSRRAKQLVSGCFLGVLAKAPLFVMVFLTASLFLAGYRWAWCREAGPVQELDGLECQVRLQILDYPDERYNRYYYPAAATVIDGDASRRVPLLLSASEPILCRPYSTVECQVKFYRFSSGGLYSTQNRRWASGAMLGAALYSSAKSWPEESWPIGRLLAEFRRAGGRRLSRLLPPDCAGLLRTVLLGQSGGLPSSVYSDFGRIGCSHMLAVSGLHMSTLTAFFSLLIARLPLRRGSSNLLKALALVFYMCLTGFPASALRSGIMFLVYLAADSLGRQTAGLNSLGAAVLVICLSNPFAGGDLGFALSALSTLGILLAQKRICRALAKPFQGFPRMGRRLRPLLESVSVTLSATLFTLPIQVEVFGGLPLLAPFANLLLLPLIAVLLYSSAFLICLAPFPAAAPLAQPFVFCSGWVSRAILWTAHQLALIPGCYFSLRDPLWLLMLPVSAGVALIGWRRGRNRSEKGKALALGVLLAACAGLFQLVYWQGSVTVLVSGEPASPCVLVMKDGCAAALSLGGYNSSFAGDQLSAHNVLALKSVFLPVRGPQARAMAAELLASRPPELLLLPEGAYAGKDLQESGVPLARVPQESLYEVLPGVWVQPAQEGKCIRFWVNGQKFLVELERCEPERAGLLVTGLPDSQIEAPLRVLLDAKEEDGAFQAASSGCYLLADGDTAACLYVFPDGSIRSG